MFSWLSSKRCMNISLHPSNLDIPLHFWFLLYISNTRLKVKVCRWKSFDFIQCWRLVVTSFLSLFYNFKWSNGRCLYVSLASIRFLKEKSTHPSHRNSEPNWAAQKFLSFSFTKEISDRNEMNDSAFEKRIQMNCQIVCRSYCNQPLHLSCKLSWNLEHVFRLRNLRKSMFWRYMIV